MDMDQKQGVQPGMSGDRLLDRYLSQTDVWAIAFGCIIGWGAFVMPGTTFLPIAGPVGTTIAMVISVAIMLVIGRNYAYLMTRRPGTGGVYTYTREAFGRDHAFLCSWFLSLSYISVVFLNATALFVVTRTLFGGALQIGPHYQVAGYEVYLGEVGLSVLVLLIIGLLFILQKPLLQHVQTVLAAILLVGTLIVTLACLPGLGKVDQSNLFGTGSSSPATVILTIVLLSPWAFVGFDVVSLETAHFNFPVRKSQRIIVLSIAVGGLVYIAMSCVSVTAVPDGFANWSEYIGALGSLAGVEAVPTFLAAEHTMGRFGLVVMGLTALAAILTGVIAAYRATVRILSTMAEDHILSQHFSNTTFCVLFIMVISALVSFLGRNALEEFVELTTFGAIVGFGYTSASAWRMARRENDRTGAAFGAAGTVITGAFAVVQLIPQITIQETMGAESFLMLSVWCLLGFAFYWRTMRQIGLGEYNGVTLSSTVLFSLLLYSAFMWFVLSVLGITGAEGLRGLILRRSAVMLGLLGTGLVVMVRIQSMLRERHEHLEREVIHSEESSLAKTQFLFNMSHDIRTPMNAIIGYTSLALKEEHSEAVGEYLSKINTSSQHLLELINDILEMSRIESGTIVLEPEPLDICSCVDEMHSLFLNQMEEKEIEFTADAAQVRHPWVLCDRRNLNRAMFNVISNAWKFTPRGGTISVTLWEVEGEATGRSLYELHIKDNGIGMSRAFTEKMWGAFERERTSTASGIQGTGLGLPITKNIIDLMGGTIEVRTAPGCGTEFIMRIGLEWTDKPAPEAEPAPEAPAVREVDFTKMRLLLAEDNAINSEIAVMILQQAGFTVETAVDGKEALEKVRNSKPGYYNAVLMDIQMPVMDGYEATREIRKLPDPALANIPILAMTANAMKEDEDASREAGMQAHIAKPLDIPKMMNTLRDVLGRTE